ncbi:Flagellar hook-length control protein FliK [Actinosynnema pretiosum subsp. pretiosum]|nr:Flagellar hook-length control protein FliK [Actinosynnema pretiosum subsp. pretiosum]
MGMEGRGASEPPWGADGACGLGAEGRAPEDGFLPSPLACASRSRRATGASTVLDADFTYSP